MSFLDTIKNVHIIGIGGISLSALALILKAQGKFVSGSDKVFSKITQKLQQEGITVSNKIEYELIEKADLVVYSSAIPKDDEQLILATKLNKRVVSRAELLSEIAKNYYTISVAGSHGKTTATSMIGEIFLYANKSPTIHVGGIMKKLNSNVMIGEGKYFITEACEYKDSFLELFSDVSVVLNEDPDHLDYFKTKENYYKSFEKYAKNTKKTGVLVVNNDDLFARKLKTNNIFTYAIKNKADLQAKNIHRQNGYLQFDLFYMGLDFGNFKIKCLGEHNIYNALSAIAVGIICGISLQEIKEALSLYKGVERRLEIIKDDYKSVIIHDYAHHPDEIVATIKAIKQSFDKKLICIFQPHTFSRTRDLYYEFCHSFIEADEVWLLPIYPAREKPIAKITSKFLAKGISRFNENVRYFSNFDKCFRFIKKIEKEESVFLILGAGDIVDLAYKFKRNDT